jgi:hypothetical protein
MKDRLYPVLPTWGGHVFLPDEQTARGIEELVCAPLR